jgi:tetratricopeptide (TPR) repeat protein
MFGTHSMMAMRSLYHSRQICVDLHAAAAYNSRAFNEMSDPLRHDVSDDRNAHVRIEELLVAGLDHYFAAQYEEAIHLWTRVLFLDRGHARARAYIERARSAVAERQRESEELLHRGVAAFNEGDTGEARSLLTRAVERGASDPEALAVLSRLDRLEAGTAPVATETRRRTVGTGLSPVHDEDQSASGRSWVLVCAVILLAFIIGAGLVLSGAVAVPDFALGSEGRGAAMVGRTLDPLPLPSASEVALARARASFDTGRLRDALRLLDTIAQGDPLEPEADALRASIHRALLATAGPNGLPVPRR